MFTRPMSLKWATTALLKKKKRKPKDSLGYTETRFSMVEVITLEVQVSYSDGNLLLTIWMLKKESLIGYSSRTKTTQKDATKSSNKILKEGRSTPNTIMLMKSINSIASIKKIK